MKRDVGVTDYDKIFIPHPFNFVAPARHENARKPHYEESMKKQRCRSGIWNSCLTCFYYPYIPLHFCRNDCHYLFHFLEGASHNVIVL